MPHFDFHLLRLRRYPHIYAATEEGHTSFGGDKLIQFDRGEKREGVLKG